MTRSNPPSPSPNVRKKQKAVPKQFKSRIFFNANPKTENTTVKKKQIAKQDSYDGFLLRCSFPQHRMFSYRLLDGIGIGTESGKIFPVRTRAKEADKPVKKVKCKSDDQFHIGSSFCIRSRSMGRRRRWFAARAARLAGSLCQSLLHRALKHPVKSRHLSSVCFQGQHSSFKTKAYRTKR